MGRNLKLAVTILAMALNAVTAAFAYSFVGELDLSFGMRYLAGLLIMLSPMFTFLLAMALWRKEKKADETA